MSESVKSVIEVDDPTSTLELPQDETESCSSQCDVTSSCRLTEPVQRNAPTNAEANVDNRWSGYVGVAASVVVAGVVYYIYCRK